MWKRVDVYLPRFSESQKSRFRSFSPLHFHGAEAPRGLCRRSGDPPRFSWEGKLELTEVLRHLTAVGLFFPFPSSARLEGMWTEAFAMASPRAYFTQVGDGHARRHCDTSAQFYERGRRGEVADVRLRSACMERTSWRPSIVTLERSNRRGGGPHPSSAEPLHAPWHFLYFFPLPQGQGLLRPPLSSLR